jgi:hypothetical protein
MKKSSNLDERMMMSINQPVKIKLSLLRNWREQMLNDINLDLEIDNEHNLTEDEKEVYRYGLVRGWNECVSTLNLQKIVKRIID